MSQSCNCEVSEALGEALAESKANEAKLREVLERIVKECPDPMMSHPGDTWSAALGDLITETAKRVLEETRP